MNTKTMMRKLQEKGYSQEEIQGNWQIHKKWGMEYPEWVGMMKAVVEVIPYKGVVVQALNPKLLEIRSEAQKLAGGGASWDRCQQMIWKALENHGMDPDEAKFAHDIGIDENGFKFEIIRFDYPSWMLVRSWWDNLEIE